VFYKNTGNIQKLQLLYIICSIVKHPDDGHRSKCNMFVNITIC